MTREDFWSTSTPPFAVLHHCTLVWADLKVGCCG